MRIIRRGESTMMNLVWRLPVVTLRLQTAPDQLEATFQAESQESFPPDFVELFDTGQNCHFLKKKQFWLNSTEQSVGALQGNNTQIPRFQSIPLGSKSFRPVLYHHGELRPHFNLILTTDLRTEDRALQTVDLIPRKLSGKHTVDWKNMKKYRVSYFFHVGFQHRIISWFSFCFWLVFEVNSTASRRGGLGLSAFVQPVPFATEATSSFGVDEAGWMHMDALNVAFCMDFVLMVLWSIFNCLSGIICFAYDCGMDAINNNRNKA